MNRETLVRLVVPWRIMIFVICALSEKKKIMTLNIFMCLQFMLVKFLTMPIFMIPFVMRQKIVQFVQELLEDVEKNEGNFFYQKNLLILQIFKLQMVQK